LRKTARENRKRKVIGMKKKKKTLLYKIVFKISYHITFIYFIIKGLLGGKDK